MEYVVDQNYFRKDDLKNLVNNSSNRFIVTDSALLEMSKSEQWESTIRASLKTISEIPDQVDFIISIDEAMAFENSNNRAITKNDLVREDYNAFFKGLLGEIKRQEFGTSFTLLKSKLSANVDVFRSGILNHQQCKLTFGGLIERIKDDINPDFKNALVKKQITDDALNQEIRSLVPAAFTKYFSEMGYAGSKANDFVNENPINARYLYVCLLRAFKWISNGGFEGYKPEKVTNELLDNSYVILGSYFDGILSYEKSVQNLHFNLKKVLEA
ncbi:MAG: hypothetical protein II007_01850 [Gammaproteobacteria bacterium]|nr:hypothetical protein [Gammaproteobacteria bacterium]